MLALTRYYLLVARTLPVLLTGSRKPTSAETDFHLQVDRKLWDARDRITISDTFLNAVFLKTDNRHLDFLQTKAAAFRMHRLHSLTQQRWVAQMCDEPRYDRIKSRIEHGESYNPKTYLS